MMIDDRMQDVLDAHRALHSPPIETVQPEVARQLPTLADAVREVASRRFLARIRKPGIEAVAAVEHRLIEAEGREILVRIYRPHGIRPFPVIVYFHGGGWVIADLNTYDASCRALANEAGMIVVSVAYRQAPEHKFPAAPEDAITAYAWVLEHAASFGGNPDLVSVAGKSAGGNLAAVVCLMARERGLRPPFHQLLIYPVTDHAFDTPSYETYADAKPLNREMMRWFWRHYLDHGRDALDAHASPLRAFALAGLPSVSVVLAEVDPLRSEGEAYAERLRRAGVPVTVRRYDGVTHEFFGMSGVLAQARDAVRFAAKQLAAASLIQ